MQDEVLRIRRAQKGDADAFEALVTPYEKKLFGLCLRMLGNREDAQDCLQDCMLRAWRAISGYRKESSLATWLYRIATNACLDFLRKRKVRPSVSLEMMTEAGFMPHATEGDPVQIAEETARKAALESGLASLPPDLRTALVLRDMQGLSYEDIADVLKIPTGTVKSRISRGRDKLRAHLRAERELFESHCVHIPVDIVREIPLRRNISEVAPEKERMQKNDA